MDQDYIDKIVQLKITIQDKEEKMKNIGEELIKYKKQLERAIADAKAYTKIIIPCKNIKITDCCLNNFQDIFRYLEHKDKIKFKLINKIFKNIFDSIDHKVIRYSNYLDETITYSIINGKYNFDLKNKENIFTTNWIQIEEKFNRFRNKSDKSKLDFTNKCIDIINICAYSKQKFNNKIIMSKNTKTISIIELNRIDHICNTMLIHKFYLASEIKDKIKKSNIILNKYDYDCYALHDIIKIWNKSSILDEQIYIYKLFK